jgi:hypothetical protein
MLGERPKIRGIDNSEEKTDIMLNPPPCGELPHCCKNLLTIKTVEHVH